MEPPALNLVVPSTVINARKAKNYKLDFIIVGFKAGDWTNAIAVAEHLANFNKFRKAKLTGERLYQRYQNTINAVSMSYTSDKFLRRYATEVVQFFDQDDFRTEVLNILKALPESSKRSADTMLDEAQEEEGALEELEKQESEPGKVSNSLLGTEMSVDMAVDSLANQATPTLLTYATIKTMMFERARALFVLYKDKKYISSQQRKLMSCGSSLILDLVDMAPGNDFRTLVSPQQWNALVQSFTNRYKIEESAWPAEVQERWRAATSKVSYADQFNGAKRYMHGLLKAALADTLRNEYELMLAILDTSRDISSSKSLQSASEDDYVFQIWLPIFKKLFSGTPIQLKIGETVNSESTEQKMLLFPGATNIIGFKTDMRFYYNVNENDILDLASVEASLPKSGQAKLLDDHAKLLREGKCNTAAIYRATGGTTGHSWILQISGLKCTLTTVSYSDYDLHVATSQDVITFPTSVNDFNNLNDVTKFLQVLHTFKNDLWAIAERIQKSSREEPQILGMQQAPSAISFFTPPKEDLPRAQFPDINNQILHSGTDVSLLRT
ncbi:unnamed protein product [Mucor circinelloides]